MVNASTGLYKAGAVMHCDIDMDRGLAFFWQGGDSTGMVIPNLSYDEQFAGFYDTDGKKVYVKTIELGQFPSSNSSSIAASKEVLHTISGLYRKINMITHWGLMPDGSANVGNLTIPWYGAVYFHFTDQNVTIITSYNWAHCSGRAILYYTCTDR